MVPVQHGLNPKPGKIKGHWFWRHVLCPCCSVHMRGPKHKIATANSHFENPAGRTIDHLRDMQLRP
jgi:hypothetical protein